MTLPARFESVEAVEDFMTTPSDALIADLAPLNSGYYIGESNTVEKPSNAPSAFLPENWKRLADLRDKYDPDGVFFGYFDGLR